MINKKTSVLLCAVLFAGCAALCADVSSEFKASKGASVPKDWTLVQADAYAAPVETRILPTGDWGENRFFVKAAADKPCRFVFNKVQSFSANREIEVAVEASGTGSIVVGYQLLDANKVVCKESSRTCTLRGPHDSEDFELKEIFQASDQANLKAVPKYIRMFFEVTKGSQATFEEAELDVDRLGGWWPF